MTSTTDWKDLTQRRTHVKRSILLLLLGSPFFGAAATGALEHLPIQKPGPIPFALFLFFGGYTLASFAYYAVAFTRLACWRRPNCRQRFFGTTIFYCVPFGNTCKHCEATKPTW